MATRGARATSAGTIETGAPLPRDKIETLNRSRTFLSGLAMVRQIEFALFDFRLHDEYTPERGSRVQELLDEVRREVAVVEPPAYNRFAHSFGHVFGGGYAAGYYSYKWAEVLAADAFAAFEEAGVFDRATAERFRRAVLATGGSRNALDAFIEFRGRAPELDALLKQRHRAGIVALNRRAGRALDALKVATWNVNSLRVRLPHVLEVARARATRPPRAARDEAQGRGLPGRHVPRLRLRRHLQRPVCLQRRRDPLARAAERGQLWTSAAHYADEQKRVLGATFGPLRLWSLYVPNGQSVESDKYRYKLEWLAALRVLLADELARHPALLLVGDFNIAPDDRDVHNPAAWAGQGSVHAGRASGARGASASSGCATHSGCSRSRRRSSAGGITARARFAAIRGFGSTSCWPRRALSQTCIGCRIDKEPRGWERPSDHVPVVAEFTAS